MSGRFLVASDGRYLDADDEALSILGRTRDEVLAARIGDFAGPHAELARTVWARLAGEGQPIPTGEASVFRADGGAIRVRYTRIERRPDGSYELELEEIGQGAGPPQVDKPSAVLDAWRAAEREREAVAALDGNGDPASEALRTLYQHGVRRRSGQAEP
ncbi:MAG: hypothetical protein FIA92_06155 [Chloroflexi bacterium]|nr:hypothetical protein [Chloroflexota bacterium]